MVFSFENQGNNTYLVVELPAEAEIDTMTLGMITNNSIEGVASAFFTQLDDTKYVKYNISSKVSLFQLLEGPVNKKKVVGVFTGICNALRNAEDYMLEPGSFLYDLDKIYVNVSTLEVALICVPVLDMVQDVQNVGILFKNIMFSAQFDIAENNDYVGKIINYLNSAPAFSAEGFKEMLDSLQKNAPTEVPIQAVQATANPAIQSSVTPNANPTMQSSVTPVANPAMQPSITPIANPAMQPSVTPAVNPIAQPSVTSAAQPSVAPVSVTQPPKAVGGKQQAANVQIPKPSQPVQSAVKSGMAIPAAPKPVTGQAVQRKQTAPKKEKKGFSLFGNKSAKQPITQPPVQQSVTRQQAMPMQQPAIGQQVMSVQQPVTGQQAMPVQQPVAGQQAMPVQQPVPVQQPIPEQQSPIQRAPFGGNFGETTVLGGGAAIGETTVLGVSQTTAVQPYLIRRKTDEHIPITKPVFRIGKEKSYVDYFINDNTAISRSHANVIMREGKYYVVDTNSTNHTYVNGQLLQSNIETEIAHGAVVRLANEDFEFRTY